jgi:hypothetical protein
MAAKIVRGEIGTAPVASEAKVTMPSATVNSTMSVRGLSLRLSRLLTSGGLPCWLEAAELLDTVAISIAKIRLQS